MKVPLRILLVGAAVYLFSACGAEPPTPTPTLSPTATATPMPTPTHTPTPLPTPTATTGEPAWQQGLKNHRAHDYAAALQSYQQAMETLPEISVDHPEVLPFAVSLSLAMAEAYLVTGNYLGARTMATQVLEFLGLPIPRLGMLPIRELRDMADVMVIGAWFLKVPTSRWLQPIGRGR